MSPEANVAPTAVLAFMVTLQVVVPLHAPDQPVNAEGDEVEAVRATTAPAGKVARQVEPQLIPEGLLAMVPEPVPALVTVS